MTKSKQQTRIRIPAPILAIIHITMAVLLGWLAPLPIPAPIFVQWLGLGLAALGFIFGILAFIEFRRARSARNSKNPMIGFITSGIYHYTRNPIYLGFVFMLIGISLNLGSYWGILLAWPLIVFTNNFVIKAEETFLENKFKKDYLDYKAQVRRWL